MHLSSTQVNTLLNPLLLRSHQQFTLTYSMLLVPPCFCSGQFPVPCCDSHPGLPGLCSAWTRSSRLQHDSLCCSHACCCARLPWVRACGLLIGLVNIDFTDCKASFNHFDSSLTGLCIRTVCTEQKSTWVPVLCHSLVWTPLVSCSSNFIVSIQGGYPAAYRVAQSASAATAAYSDGYVLSDVCFTMMFSTWSSLSSVNVFFYHTSKLNFSFH